MREAPNDAATRRRAPWLWERYPRLATRLPWLPLVDVPTPVEPLETLSRRLDREIWIKRDDRTSSAYGGNKPRKLEFLLADARSRELGAVLTTGGLGTNHGLATAVFGKRLGFRVTLGLFRQPVTDHVRRSLLLYHAFGAEMIYLGKPPAAALRYALLGRRRRRHTYLIPGGGSNSLGVLGYVDAGIELALQVERGELPVPERIFVAAGTCGTQAGLVLGLRLAGLRSRVIAVRVVPAILANPSTALRLARGAARRLRGLDGTIRAPAFSRRDFVMDTAHYGSGYGHPTESGRRAMALAADAEGIQLDLTYTAKAFAALVDAAKGDAGRGPVLFWNTFNSVDLAARAGRVDPRELPAVFRRFISGP